MTAFFSAKLGIQDKPHWFSVLTYFAKTELLVNEYETRNKSNASFEAVQYRQDMRHIAHYHNIKNLACLYTLLRKSE